MKKIGTGLRGTATRLRRTARRQQALVEALELREMCSATTLSLFAPTPAVVVTAVAAGAGNVAVDRHGGVWYTAGNSLEKAMAGGTAHQAVPAGGDGGARTIVSNVVFTADDSAWFVVAANGGNQLERMTAGGVFEDATGVVHAALGHLTVSQDAVWFTRGDSAVGFVNAGGGTGLIAVPGTLLTGLTTGPDGNVWFGGAASGGQGVVGKVTAGGMVQKYAVPGAVESMAAGKDGCVYAGGQDAIWRVTGTGSVTEVAHGSFKAQMLTSATDGTLWFMDGEHPAQAINRVLGGGMLLQYGPGIPGAVMTSMVATGESIWFTAADSATAWLGKLQVSLGSGTAGDLAICNAVYAGQIGGTMAAISAALSISDSRTNSVVPADGTNSSSNGTDTNTTSGNSEATNPPATAGTDGGAAPAAQFLHTTNHLESVPGAAANHSADRTGTGNSEAVAKRSGAEGTQDPGTFEGEFRVRTPQGYTLPPVKTSGHTYYSSAGQSSRGLVLEAGRWGDERVLQMAYGADFGGMAARVQPVTAGVQGGEMTGIPAYQSRNGAGGETTRQTAAQAPAIMVEDWWRLAAYFSAATGLQGWWPTSRRFGEWSPWNPS
jgi:hypothetical protein